MPVLTVDEIVLLGEHRGLRLFAAARRSNDDNARSARRGRARRLADERQHCTHTHTLILILYLKTRNRQTCMNKMQMTITKEKKITTYT